MLRVADASVAIAWYARLGFSKSQNTGLRQACQHSSPSPEEA